MRNLGTQPVYQVGYGAMNISHGYKPKQDDETCERMLNRALDLGYTHIDSAAVYGHGHNETMIGKYLAHRRSDYVLASKFGFVSDAGDGKPGISNHPAEMRRACEASLSKLKTDVIDLYYVHRWDRVTPIEEVAGEMGRLIDEGKIRQYGLSEVSAGTIRTAHAERPCAAVQSEYSLWTRNPEIAVIDTCKELGITFVAFSPLARQFLTGKLPATPDIKEGDLRYGMPRFEGEAWEKNARLLGEYGRIAEEAGCSMAQLAVAWTLAKGDHIIPIPGTADIDHLEENIGGGEVDLSDDLVVRLDDLINQNTVTGGRYTPKMQATVGTEDFPA